MAEHLFPWTEAFLAALREYPVLAHAAKVVGIDRTTAWRRAQADKDFADAVEQAMEAGIDRAEKEAFRRGVVGFEEPVIYQGDLMMREVRDEKGALVYDAAGNVLMQPLTVRKHSDALLALVLKGRRRAYSTERQEHVSPDGSMTPDPVARDSRVAQILAAAQQRKAAAAEQSSNEYDDLA